jgi:hypothetical protein
MNTSGMSFDDVLDALMLEESEPTYAVLVKWSKLYPEYRDQLARYFSTWSRQRLLAADADAKPVVIDEEKLVARTVQYALDLAEQQGRILPDDAAVASLNPFDELVLAAIYAFRGAAYSANITDEVSRVSARWVSLGSTFASLGRLERQGLIEARVADGKTEREHKGRRYFTATLRGEHALAEARETSTRLADFLGDFA